GPPEPTGRILVRLADGATIAGHLTEASEPAVGAEVIVAIRPESVDIGPARRGTDTAGLTAARSSVTGRLRSNTYLGNQHEYRADVPGLGEFVARTQTSSVDETGRTFAAGEEVAISWHEASALVLTS
ncbi:MAG TPA: TOBE domain-containing protein, partial [Candidatus Limnocylindrales bacterium]|nr:TOBE domain-containing protein [Candidatus Limnocylindrales bacterium]